MNQRIQPRLGGVRVFSKVPSAVEGRVRTTALAGAVRKVMVNRIKLGCRYIRILIEIKHRIE
jgi:hypothetical protein